MFWIICMAGRADLVLCMRRSRGLPEAILRQETLYHKEGEPSDSSSGVRRQRLGRADAAARVWKEVGVKVFWFLLVFFPLKCSLRQRFDIHVQTCCLELADTGFSHFILLG